ncbi:MAG: DUF6763 family protein [Steroidobacteraceae bacterium]|jgi:hypothetical protein
MNSVVGRARIDQWYRRQDKGEAFLVTAYDDKSRTIEIQTFDGDVDEIDEEVWSTLPLELAEPPENWTGPVDDVEVDDLGYTETDMAEADWSAPLQPLAPAGEAWEDTTDETERDAEGEGVPEEELALDNPISKARLS